MGTRAALVRLIISSTVMIATLAIGPRGTAGICDPSPLLIVSNGDRGPEIDVIKDRHLGFRGDACGWDYGGKKLSACQT